jgi:SOS-response transcriptional repressor LexA
MNNKRKMKKKIRLISKDDPIGQIPIFSLTNFLFSYQSFSQKLSVNQQTTAHHMLFLCSHKVVSEEYSLPLKTRLQAWELVRYRKQNHTKM